MKILCVIGTRPEAIKMAPVVMELRRHSDRFETRVCVTGQHREMLDPVLRLFGIVPDYDLDVMRANQTLTQVTADVLTRLEPVIADEHPDWILVQGDTTTVLAASLLGYYQRVRVGHVEAGLRTGNKFHPFPEEINRKLTDNICDLHFAPTEMSRQNLLREGIADASIRVTGNTVIDALHLAVQQPPTPETLVLLRQLGLAPGTNGEDSAHSVKRAPRLILVTAHRRENFGAPLENICRALKELAACYPDVRIVYPVHLNPNVQRVVRASLSDIPGITLLPPLDYLPLVYLMKHSYLVLTDSGGLQEEAPGLGKPVLVLRPVTERPEAVLAGTVKLVGTDARTIVSETARLLDDRTAYECMARAVNPYGDGHASERIVNALCETEAPPSWGAIESWELPL